MRAHQDQNAPRNNQSLNKIKIPDFKSRLSEEVSHCSLNKMGLSKQNTANHEFPWSLDQNFKLHWQL